MLKIQKLISIILVLFLVLTISPVKKSAEDAVGVTYAAHVQSIGWQTWVRDNNIAGTTEQGLRLEALKIQLTNPIPGMKIKYQAHVQNIGWQDWVYDGNVAGTEGQALRVEAIRIQLEGAPVGYHVRYQVHVQDFGWMDPVADGEIAGTVGQTRRIEAIKISIENNSYQTQICEPLQSCLENGDFELPLLGTKIQGWSQVGTAGYSSLTSYNYSGNQGLKIDDISEIDSVGLESSNVTVKPGEVISASTIVNTSDNATLMLRFYDANGVYIKSIAKNGSTEGLWEKFSLSGVVPNNAKTATVLLYSSEADVGTYYYDDVRIFKTTSIVYRGNLPSNQVHTYRFTTTKEGMVNVNFMNSPSIQYVIRLLKPSEGTETTDATDTYFDSDILPVGEYEIVFSPLDLVSQPYEVVLSGDLGQTGQISLPSLDISNPSSPYTLLSKGNFSTNISGTSDGTVLNYTLNHNKPVVLTNTFSQTLNLLFGANKINFYAESSNKNSINDIRKVVSPGVQRVFGSDRFVTAVEISKEIEKEGYELKTVIITDTSNFSDGIPGIVLGYKETAPILPTNPDSLPYVIKNEISRLGAEKAIILGGTNTVSSNVELELANMGLTVERISGIDKDEVATNIANKVIDDYTNSAIIVSGDSYEDGLLASSYAANSGKPILYSSKFSLSPKTKDFLESHPNINQFTIIDGNGLISDSVITELENYGSVYKVDGIDHYEIGLNIPRALDYQKSGYVLVSNVVEGIPAAVLSSLKETHILLTDPTTLPSSVRDYLTGLGGDHLLENVYIVGGTSSVSASIEQYIDSIIE